MAIRPSRRSPTRFRLPRRSPPRSPIPAWWRRRARPPRRSDTRCWFRSAAARPAGCWSTRPSRPQHAWPAGRRWCLITGPNLPQADFDAAARQGAGRPRHRPLPQGFPGAAGGCRAVRLAGRLQHRLRCPAGRLPLDPGSLRGRRRDRADGARRAAASGSDWPWRCPRTICRRQASARQSNGSWLHQARLAHARPRRRAKVGGDRCCAADSQLAECAARRAPISMKRLYFFIGSVPENAEPGKPGLPLEGLDGFHAIDVGRLAEIVVRLQQHVGALRQEAEPCRADRQCARSWC